MRVLSRLLAALTIAGLLLPVAAVPVLAATDITSMSIRPKSSGPIGTEVYLRGNADDNDEGWVYFQMEDDEWVKVLDDSDDWDFDQEGEEPEEYYSYTTEGDTFEIPECTGGKH